MIPNQITGRFWRALTATARGVVYAALCASLAIPLSVAPIAPIAQDAAAQTRAPRVHQLAIEGANRIGRVALELDAPAPPPRVSLGPTARSLIIEMIPLNWPLPTQGRPENEPMVNQFRLRQTPRGAALILDLAVDVVNAFPAVHSSPSGRYVIEVYFITDMAEAPADQAAPPALYASAPVEVENQAAASPPRGPRPPRLRASAARLAQRDPGAPQGRPAAPPPAQTSIVSAPPAARLRALEREFQSGQRMPDDMYFLSARRNAAEALGAANQGRALFQRNQPRNQLSAAPPRPNIPQTTARRRPDGLQFVYPEAPFKVPDRLALDQAVRGSAVRAPEPLTNLAAAPSELNAAIDGLLAPQAPGRAQEVRPAAPPPPTTQLAGTPSATATPAATTPAPPRLRPPRPEPPVQIASIAPVRLGLLARPPAEPVAQPPQGRAAPTRPAPPAGARNSLRVAGPPARPAPIQDPVRIDFGIINRFLQESPPPMIESAQPPARPKRLIVIDPGHGDHDPGAVVGDIYEKDLVLAYALDLRAALEATGQYRVLLTRDDDTFLSLEGRVEFARARDALLFVSLHADALESGGDARGLAVYTLSDTAAEQEIRMITRGERDVGAVGGVHLHNHSPEVRSLVVDITQRETLIRSEAFARILTNKLSGVTKLLPTSLRLAGFRVLKAPDTPSVLVELGFLTNAEDRAQLQSEEWRAKTVPHFVEAINLWGAATEARRLDAR